MNLRKPAPKVRKNRGWLVVFVVELLAPPVMLLVLVWGGIERTDTTYFINIVQNEVREKEALRAKLEVELERLLAPHELRSKAEILGMHEPSPGQVRRLEQN